MSSVDGPIIIAFDGSEPARHAITAAAQTLASRRALVLTVWEPALAYAMVADSPDVSIPSTVSPDVALALDDELHSQATRIAQEGAGLATSAGLEAEAVALPDAGGIGRTILQVAGERDAAAIVVGSRGLGGIRARIEGSTSKAVLKDASCPVLVVHGADDDS
jgi:nucleotide-binding universal stress UspA family protein